MEVKDLSKEQLLQELKNEKQKIMQLIKQRSGIDGQIETERFRTKEIQEEINRRYQEGKE
jgi:hypothetical protein